MCASIFRSSSESKNGFSDRSTNQAGKSAQKTSERLAALIARPDRAIVEVEIVLDDLAAANDREIRLLYGSRIEVMAFENSRLFAHLKSDVIAQVTNFWFSKIRPQYSTQTLRHLVIRVYEINAQKVIDAFEKLEGERFRSADIASPDHRRGRDD